MPDIDPMELTLNARDPPYFYLSTLQAATASVHSLYVNFISSSEHNVVVK